jgi:3-isopropylmalate dehydrogenase
VRYPDGTEIAPQLELRFDLGLYAGVRPMRAIPGVRPVLADPRAADIDFVLIRESTEGLFASYGKGVVDRRQRQRDHGDHQGCLRAAVRLLLPPRPQAQGGKGSPGRVTCVDKANIFKSAFAFFRGIFNERARLNPDIAADSAYVGRHGPVDGAEALGLRRDGHREHVRRHPLRPRRGLIGGMGMAPSADIGDDHAVFQPCHGSAPDIMGTGKANPTAMVLSAAMMLDWLGDRHHVPEAVRAGQLLSDAVDRAFEAGTLVTCELGGTDGTEAVTTAVRRALDDLPVPEVP